ncbi:MAG: phosphate acyltransferase PlsX [Verrucomicrobiota bacterium]
MRIAVDAMGGDYAPREIVAGTLEAARTLQGLDKLYLVGDETVLRQELKSRGDVPGSVEIRHASEVVSMDETPAVAIRRKKDSSISRAVEMVKAGEADAVFSAGSTGAAVAAATLKLRTLEGVDRPAIACVLPTPVKPFVLLDAGATTDCTPELLVQFAVMGTVYSREIVGAKNPLVGLLSVGTEDSKGNENTKAAFKLLEKSGLNFHGNVEGHDLFEGHMDVVVCDGFVGNVVLKASESAVHAIGRWIKEEFTRNPLRMLGALLVKPGLDSIKKKSDPSMYGGAPLLGVNGIVIIGHGASNAQAVRNGIRVASESVSHRVTDCIVEGLKKVWEAQ